MVNIGIIGTGFGATQAKTFSLIQGCKVFGICGNDYRKTSEIAAEIGIPNVYNTYLDLLSDSSIDLVCISSPNKLHKGMFLKAMESDKHILLEKPAGITSDEVEEMLEKSRGYKKLIAVDHEMRFNPVTLEIIELIETLGEIGSVQIFQYTNHGSLENSQYTWMNSLENGGGQTLLMGTHLIDLGRYLLGMKEVTNGNLIKTIFKTSKPSSDGGLHEVDAEAQINANLKLVGGISLSFFNTLYSFGLKDFEIKIFGSKGIILYSDTNGLKISYSNSNGLNEVKVDDKLETIHTGNSFVSKSFKYFAYDLIRYLNGELAGLPYCTLKEALENIKILESLN